MAEGLIKYIFPEHRKIFYIILCHTHLRTTAKVFGECFLLYCLCAHKTQSQAFLQPGRGGEGMSLTSIKGEERLLIPAWKSTNFFTTPSQDLKNRKLLLYSENIWGFEFVLVWLLLLLIRKSNFCSIMFQLHKTEAEAWFRVQHITKACSRVCFLSVLNFVHLWPTGPWKWNTLRKMWWGKNKKEKTSDQLWLYQMFSFGPDLLPR